MAKKQKVQYSANFKRDYIAGLAIVIFFAIVIGEIALAVGIPTYLNRESSMAFQVRRLNMLSDFDALRQQAVIVRYFAGADTGNYVRITVGTDNEIDRLLQVTDDYLK